MTTDRVMLLIDADNVSVDVMEQAVRLLLNQHGGLHVRRAYCTAESAVANQAAFKRLGIKPMVNLAAGKNSTDIALAVDAIDLVLAERPDVVVIASSDSDFAPLVHRLREKGCVVRGIGQMGKTGDETQEVYDDFTVLEHRKAAAGGEAASARKNTRTASRKTTAKTAAKAPAAKKAPAARKVATKTVAAKTAPRKVAARKSAASAAPVAETVEVAQVHAEPMAVQDTAPPAAPAAAAPEVQATRSSRGRGGRTSRARAEATAPAPSGAPGARGGASVQAVLDCLPELAAGQALALNVAVQRLREAQLLGKNSSSLKLFAQLSDHFDLTPANKPTQVRLRR